MAKYQLRSDSGVTVTANAQTLTGAKREATNWASFGAGDIYVDQNGDTIAKREFWQERNRFGWLPWQSVS
jgi:hypothetical protein